MPVAGKGPTWDLNQRTVGKPLLPADFMCSFRIREALSKVNSKKKLENGQRYKQVFPKEKMWIRHEKMCSIVSLWGDAR